MNHAVSQKIRQSINIRIFYWCFAFYPESVGNLWVLLRYARPIMTEHSTSDSFIVRIYRFDTDDQRKLTGLVETMDGAGKRLPFTHMDELAEILNRCVKPRKSGRKASRRVDSK
jgi:hypothetical protein